MMLIDLLSDSTIVEPFFTKGGEAMGKVYTRRRPLNEKERVACRMFLETIGQFKHERTRTTMADVNLNQVKLSGKIEKIQADEDRWFALINVGLEKWVPVTGHKKDNAQRPGLMDDLAKFQENDRIEIKGYCRPWSMQKEGKWVNSMDIRVIDLNPACIPNRQPQKKDKSASGWGNEW